MAYDMRISDWSSDVFSSDLIVYYLYPAAPPWYIQQYGTDFIKDTPSNAAQLVKFDQFFNVPVFQTLYSKGSNVFAAMPSLHSSYPLIVIYYGIDRKSVV